MTMMTSYDPESLGFMQSTDTDILLQVATGKIDLNLIARIELAYRGLDHEGKWIGYWKARCQLIAYQGGTP